MEEALRFAADLLPGFELEELGQECRIGFGEEERAVRPAAFALDYGD